MDQQADISREGDFYVPAFEVRVRGRRLHRTVINDVISLGYTDDLKAIDQFSMTINNWNAETRSFKYSDADLFLPKAEIEIDIGLRQEERSEEHTSELQSLMRISYAVFCLKKKRNTKYKQSNNINREQHHKYKTLTK